METFFKCARTFLGDSAINDDKTVRPMKKTDFLGWECDLTNEVCYSNEKGCSKLLVVFFCFDATKPQSRELWEVLAGVAERYSVGLVGMRAFVSPPFHHMKEKCHCGRKPDTSGRPRSWGAAAISSALFCIEMWRSEALSLWHDPMLVAVPMRNMAGSKLIRPAVFKTESDAGPEGVGAVVYDQHEVRLAYTSYKLPWARDLKNKFQN
jgi:hypothetical protein